ncbi:Hypothetical predicted protein [Olea europaea subsp. europaea]|uniref:Uncharacterized protein n=1 Tax=Olea europaea subsp. europaea TaxID=158383 RepID=A0A8S0TNL3_OLEEU|nr:Hypothetical predicted protein [Olea europaea subsp. europaea]
MGARSASVHSFSRPAGWPAAATRERVNCELPVSAMRPTENKWPPRPLVNEKAQWQFANLLRRATSGRRTGGRAGGRQTQARAWRLSTRRWKGTGRAGTRSTSGGGPPNLCEWRVVRSASHRQSCAFKLGAVCIGPKLYSRKVELGQCRGEKIYSLMHSLKQQQQQQQQARDTRREEETKQMKLPGRTKRSRRARNEIKIIIIVIRPRAVHWRWRRRPAEIMICWGLLSARGLRVFVNLDARARAAETREPKVARSERTMATSFNLSARCRANQTAQQNEVALPRPRSRDEHEFGIDFSHGSRLQITCWPAASQSADALVGLARLGVPQRNENAKLETPNERAAQFARAALPCSWWRKCQFAAPPARYGESTLLIDARAGVDFRRIGSSYDETRALTRRARVGNLTFRNNLNVANHAREGERERDDGRHGRNRGRNFRTLREGTSRAARVSGQPPAWAGARTALTFAFLRKAKTRIDDAIDEHSQLLRLARPGPHRSASSRADGSDGRAP